jgi:hypothetical protein
MEEDGEMDGEPQKGKKKRKNDGGLNFVDDEVRIHYPRFCSLYDIFNDFRRSTKMSIRMSRKETSRQVPARKRKKLLNLLREKAESSKLSLTLTMKKINQLRFSIL